MLLVHRVMKALYNISSDGVLPSLCGKPPTGSNTCLTTPHKAGRMALRGKGRIILIRLLSTWGDFRAVDRKDFTVLHSRTYKWIMISVWTKPC